MALFLQIQSITHIYWKKNIQLEMFHKHRCFTNWENHERCPFSLARMTSVANKQINHFKRKRVNHQTGKHVSNHSLPLIMLIDAAMV